MTGPPHTPGPRQSAQEAPTYRRLFPRDRPTGPITRLPRPATPLTVGDPRIRSFLHRLSTNLLDPRTARNHTELAAVGFFLRSAAIERILDRLPQRSGELLMPRGSVLHIAPANVDTVFLYSWALSALAGNCNIVRIPTRAGPAARHALDILNKLLGDADPVVSTTQHMIEYGHEDSTTIALTNACDMRVIWGGDAAVAAIRRAAPLPPRARELVFPDRTSFAVLSAAGWNHATAAVRDQAAAALNRDTRPYDQAACSSPRIVYWIGSSHATARAIDDFRHRMIAATQADPAEVSPAMAVQRRVSVYGVAADGVAARAVFHTNAYTELEITDPARAPRHWLGPGVFPYARLDTVQALADTLDGTEQTAAHFGFSHDNLQELARQLGARGVHRVVPLGHALDFAPIWDGHELIREFTRTTTITVGA